MAVLDEAALSRLDELFAAQPSAADAPAYSKALCERLTPLSVAGCRAAIFHPESQSYSLQGQELHHIRVVARLADLVATSQLLKATLEDHTGQLLACFSRLPGAESDLADETLAGWPQLRPCRPVVAIGVLVGCSATERALDLEHIANIDDGNELTHHLLEVILGHLLRTQMPPENLLHANEQGSGPLSLFSGPSLSLPPMDELTYIQRRVRDLCRDNEDSGAQLTTRSQLRQSMLGLASAIEVDLALDYLCRQGHLYTVSHDGFCVCKVNR